MLINSSISLELFRNRVALKLGEEGLSLRFVARMCTFRSDAESLRAGIKTWTAPSSQSSTLKTGKASRAEFVKFGSTS